MSSHLVKSAWICEQSFSLAEHSMGGFDTMDTATMEEIECSIVAIAAVNSSSVQWLH